MSSRSLNPFAQTHASPTFCDASVFRVDLPWDTCRLILIYCLFFILWSLGLEDAHVGAPLRTKPHHRRIRARPYSVLEFPHSVLQFPLVSFRALGLCLPTLPSPL